jgi:hypothetical protein
MINDMTIQLHTRRNSISEGLIVFDQQKLHRTSLEFLAFVTGLCQVVVVNTVN